ncbi:MAG TPA: histone H1 [Pseudolabrys sp.]|nr:histone H1 [Pseudolabrys sp.]
MARKHPKRPRDFNQAAKLVVDIATGQVERDPVQTKPDDPATEFARRGGLKGGRARAEKLSPEMRAFIAQKAAKARWKKK